MSARSSPSMRARVIATSPASLTSRSMMSARTRSIAWAPASTSAASGARRPAPAAPSGTTTCFSAPAAPRCRRARRGGGGLRRPPAPLGARAAARWSCLRAARRARTRSDRDRASSASKSSGVAATGASPVDSRDSIRCASSPRRIAPAIRALPLNVCSVRRSCRALPQSPGARRQPRTSLAGLRIELRRLLEEDRQHLLVDVVANVGERVAGDSGRLLERRDVRRLRRGRRRFGREGRDGNRFRSTSARRAPPFRAR